uniref:Uncharacterized protein n=1 Tax=Pectobacterium carotovorum TaxID=554 RepID=A0A0N9MZY7_PECCA|nr:hypothetical protein [Pectobacterium carotovorum]ALG88545.1 Hypothetical protein [Pectobacterium carotovorum]
MNSPTFLLCEPNTWARIGLCELVQSLYPNDRQVPLVNVATPYDLPNNMPPPVWILCSDSLFSPAGYDWLMALATMKIMKGYTTLVCFSQTVSPTLTTYIAHLLGCRALTLDSMSHEDALLALRHQLSTPDIPLFCSGLPPAEYRAVTSLLAGISVYRLCQNLNISIKTLSGQKCKALARLNVPHLNRLHYLRNIAKRSLPVTCRYQP